MTTKKGIDDTLDIEDEDNIKPDEQEEEDNDENQDDSDKGSKENSSDDDEDDGDDDEELTPKEKKLQEVANNYKIRAEKAEARLRKDNGSDNKSNNQKSNPVKAQELSSKDMYALMNNKVHEDDIEDVVEYAKFKKISVSDALKSTLIRTTLQESAEKRATANATNKGGGRRGTYKVSTDTLISNSKKGILPDNDEDMKRLVDAEIASKKKRN